MIRYDEVSAPYKHDDVCSSMSVFASVCGFAMAGPGRDKSNKS